LAIGLAIGAVAVISAPILARHMRPAAKAAFKGALAAADELRVRIAELSETAEDLMAEVRAERAAEAAAAAAEAPGSSNPTSSDKGTDLGADPSRVVADAT
jgi:hypothetical protein